MNTFRTHTGEAVSDNRLAGALAKVADDYARAAHAIFKEDDYASHVTLAQKQLYLAESLDAADIVRGGAVNNFAVWQRINTELTGECAGLLT